MMRITQVDTIVLDEFSNLLFVEIHTDEGIVGLGETFLGARAVEAYIHESAAPLLIGEDPRDINRHMQRLKTPLGTSSTGVESRGSSAVNMALWDIAGKELGQPLYQLLGGRMRNRIRIYNTCAGPRYIRDAPEQTVRNWGVGSNGRYEDLDAFLHHADRLTQSLLDEGITGMKIWPFDIYAEKTNGTSITASDLQAGLVPFQKIRSVAGAQMDIIVEMHSLWDMPTARRIIDAVAEYEPLWIEDPVPPRFTSALTQLAQRVTPPIAISETLGGSAAYLPFLESGAADVVLTDISWVGGISEAVKVAVLAETFNRPVSFHDCTGPVVLMASTHMALSLSNVAIQETVRASYKTWYGELVNTLPDIENGYATLTAAPGIGTELLPGVRERPDARVHSTSLADIPPALSALKETTEV